MKGRVMEGSFMLSATVVPCNTITWASTTPAVMKASVFAGMAMIMSAFTGLRANVQPL